MSAPQTIYRRILRRDTHSPRSTLAITLAVLVVLGCVWAITEIILAIIGQPPLLTTIPALAATVADAAQLPAGIVAVVGAVLALTGLIIMVLALTPGRRARHVLSTKKSAAIVDDEVIATALARHAALAGNVDPDNVLVDITRRRARVHLMATSGVPVNESAVRSAIENQLRSYELSPSLKPTITVAQAGKVGA